MPIYTPPVGFHFRVAFDLDAATDADIRFREVTGLSMELTEETVNEGGENRFAHKLPGRAQYQSLTLKRGLLTDTGVRAWITDAIQNFIVRPATVWVTLLNEAHEPLQTYTVMDAWPKKWSISDFNAENSALVIETLELSYKFFRVD